MRLRHTFQISAFWSWVVWLSLTPDLGRRDPNFWVYSCLWQLSIFAQVNHDSVVTRCHLITWTSLYLTSFAHKGRLNLVPWMDPQRVLLNLALGPMIAPKAFGFQEEWLDMKNSSFGESFVARPPFLWPLQLVGVPCWTDNAPLFQFSGSELLEDVLMGQDLPEAIVLFYLWQERLVALLNNLARFSMNLFIFEISMDMLIMQMNVCMYEIMYAKCSEILISKLFPNGIIFIDFNFHLHQMLNKTSSLDTVILS